MVHRCAQGNESRIMDFAPTSKHQERRTKNEELRSKNPSPMPIRRFEDIEGWQSARELTRQVYAVAHSGEFSRDFGLRDQITRAAGSTMHNIAEGFDGGSNPEFIKYLRYSQRSCSEVQSQLYVALDQGYLSQEEFDAIYTQAERTHAKVGGFIRYLLSAPSPNTFKPGTKNS
jgi:four helix bundle protein